MARKQYVQVDVSLPECPKCGSTERTPYHNYSNIEGVTIRGVYYAKMQLRRTSCTACGQSRVERVFYQPAKDKSGKRKPDTVTDTKGSVESPACTPSKTSKKKSQQSIPRLNRE